jgi:hypothetical protein
VTIDSAWRRGVPALLAGLLVSCGGDDGTSPPPEDPLFPADYLTTYVEVRNLRTSNNHDGSNLATAAIRVHCSPDAADEYVNGAYPLPEGCVLVKTAYADPTGTVVSGYTVMQKRAPGTAPASRDWYWQETDRDRRVIRSGQLSTCINCHTSNPDCSVDLTCTLP